LTYHYAPNGELNAIGELNGQGGESPIWSAGAVDASGRLVLEKFGNGVIGRRNYSAASKQLINLEVRPETGAPFQHLTFQYDKNGTLTQRKDLIGGVNETVSYDPLTRMVTDTICRTASPCLPSVTVSYDATGNIVSRSDIGTYSYLPSQPHAVVTA